MSSGFVFLQEGSPLGMRSRRTVQSQMHQMQRRTSLPWPEPLHSLCSLFEPKQWASIRKPSLRKKVKRSRAAATGSAGGTGNRAVRASKLSTVASGFFLAKLLDLRFREGYCVAGTRPKMLQPPDCRRDSVPTSEGLAAA